MLLCKGHDSNTLLSEGGAVMVECFNDEPQLDKFYQFGVLFEKSGSIYLPIDITM